MNNGYYFFSVCLQYILDRKFNSASRKMKYHYMPMDSAPLLCPNPIVPSPSQQAGSMSIWSYMTAAIVASTVASNIVNNVSLGVRSL